jgi:hypothetical protein
MSMAVFNAAFPILPGKEEAARAFATAVLSERRAAFEESQSRASTTRETWTMQQTPMGSFMLVWFDSADIEGAFADLATSNDEFNVWMRAQIQECTGLDMAAPDDSPPPELVLDWAK